MRTKKQCRILKSLLTVTTTYFIGTFCPRESVLERGDEPEDMIKDLLRKWIFRRVERGSVVNLELLEIVEYEN